jgi:hypothetical protein
VHTKERITHGSNQMQTRKEQQQQKTFGLLLPFSTSDLDRRLPLSSRSSFGPWDLRSAPEPCRQSDEGIYGGCGVSDGAVRGDG